MSFSLASPPLPLPDIIAPRAGGRSEAEALLRNVVVEEEMEKEEGDPLSKGRARRPGKR
jgi:hypothetical protein